MNKACFANGIIGVAIKVFVANLGIGGCREKITHLTVPDTGSREGVMASCSDKKSSTNYY